MRAVAGTVERNSVVAPWWRVPGHRVRKQSLVLVLGGTGGRRLAVGEEGIE